MCLNIFSSDLSLFVSLKPGESINTIVLSIILKSTFFVTASAATYALKRSYFLSFFWGANKTINQFPVVLLPLPISPKRSKFDI
jgi:hypothetical protein